MIIRHRLFWRILFTTIMAIGSTPITTWAQSASAPELKAAFLFNFARFTEWPADILAPAQPLTVCVVEDDLVANVLQDLVKGHPIGDHAVGISRMKVDGVPHEKGACHLLYAPHLNAKMSGVLLDAVKGAAVFTIGDGDEFTQLGGVGSFFLESGKIRFAINVHSAQRARVQLSSRLLTLAKIVKDASNAVQH